MNLRAALKHGFDMLRFRADAARAVRDDARASQTSLSLIALLSVLFAALYMLLARAYLRFLAASGTPVPDAVVHSPWVLPVAAAVGVLIAWCSPLFLGLYHLCAMILKGEARFSQLLAVYLAGTTALFVLSAPILIGYVFALRDVALSLLFTPLWTAVSIYALVFQIWLIKQIYGFSVGRAIGTFLLPIAIVSGIVAMVAVLLIIFLVAMG